MEIFRQFFFILYSYFFNRGKYINSSFKISPEGNASTLVGISFFGWLLLFYYLCISMMKLYEFSKHYGKFIVIITAISSGAFINNYFDKRYLKIIGEYSNKTINKKRIIFIVVLFFIVPYLLLVLLFTEGFLSSY